MKAIKFVEGVTPYQAGEVAGFPEAEAEQYVKMGLAEFLKVTKPEKNKMQTGRKTVKK